jgi:hypothetical protein
MFEFTAPSTNTIPTLICSDNPYIATLSLLSNIFKINIPIYDESKVHKDKKQKSEIFSLGFCIWYLIFSLKNSIYNK